MTNGKTNHGVLGATSESELIIGSGEINQGEAGCVRADGGTVVLVSPSRICGGHITTENGGVVECRESAIIREVQSTADIHVLEGCTLQGEVEVINDGRIVVNANQGEGNATFKAYGGSFCLGGSGELVLQAGDDPHDATFSTYYTGATQLSDHTVRGQGIVAIQMTNYGTVLADQPDGLLDLIYSNKNYGEMIARNGGTLRLAGLNQHYNTGRFYDGSWRVEVGSTMRLMGANIVRSDAEIISRRLRERGSSDRGGGVFTRRERHLYAGGMEPGRFGSRGARLDGGRRRPSARDIRYAALRSGNPRGKRHGRRRCDERRVGQSGCTAG